MKMEPEQGSRYKDWLRAWRPRGRGSNPGRVKRPGGEADHSTPASAEVKQMWIYTSTPPYTFTA
jgi:hypothetical protein